MAKAIGRFHTIQAKRTVYGAQDAYRALEREADTQRRTQLARLAAPYRAWLLTNEAFLRREDGKKPVLSG
jgi:hypothetical protein